MSTTAILALAGFCVAAYLLGAVPFGYLMGRLAGKDIRSEGSRNIGATNCWRVCGWRFGLPAFLLDVAKGFAPTFVAWLMVRLCPAYNGLAEPSQYLLVVGCGIAAILGHVFPVYLKFRGGKAVATTLGLFLGLVPVLPFAAAAFLVWVIVFLATRYVSVASTVAALLFLALALVFEPWSLNVDAAGAWHARWPITTASVLLVALVLWRHRENYRRLLAGTENKFAGKKQS